jgi:hypothetical protein
MPGLLYYPKVMPPTEVMYRAALYWDFVATIVPGIYENILTEEVRRLRDEGLYFPVRIEGPVYDAVLPERFFVELTHLMDTIPLDELIPEPARVSRDQTNRYPLRWRAVYRDKLSLIVMHELEDMGLAHRDPGNQTVWVSTAIAELLFAIAIERVTEVARTEFPSGLFTCTADERSYWAGHRPIPVRRLPERFSRVTVPCWQVDIGGLLPLPAPGTPIQEVIEFRRRYETERIRLITAIGDLQHRLGLWTEDPRDVLAQVGAELIAAEQDLAAAGSATKLKWVRRGMYVFIAMATTMSATAATTLPVGPDLVLPAVTSTLSVAGGLAVNLATNQIATTEGAQQYSYLHLTRQRFT